jgi:hypothetical protein
LFSTEQTVAKARPEVVYHLAAAELEHDRLDAFQVQQVRKYEPRWPASHDPYLCAHALLLLDP